MGEEMEFPNTFEEFLNYYAFKDSEEVYTNGSELIQTFRVMQGYEHFSKQIKDELLDKVAERINSLHYDTCDAVTRRIEHQLKAEVFKVIEEMKAEVKNND